MKLGCIQRGQGFTRFSLLPVSLSLLISQLSFLWPSLALAQTSVPVQSNIGAMLNLFPMAIGGGALASGIIAALWLTRKNKRQTSGSNAENRNEVALMRARLDECEALLSGLSEVTLVWGPGGRAPRLYGDPAVLDEGLRGTGDVAGFSRWIVRKDEANLSRLLGALGEKGQCFELNLTTLTGKPVNALGKTLGNSTVLSLRQTARTEAALFGENGRETDQKSDREATPPPVAPAIQLTVEQTSDALHQQVPPIRMTQPIQIDGVIEAFSTPVVIFDAEGDLKQFNAAYSKMWQLDEAWLRRGINERAIIDQLRTRGQLPAVSNYQEWRAAHLQSYTLKHLRKESWHLPDGRSIEVIAAPATGEGGVIYVFEDVTEHLRLQSTNKSLNNVQRETLNALSEGVAVFGTDGRLRLHNPQLSGIWKIPINVLERQPHIDEIGRQCAKTIKADGEQIWAKLKLDVVSLDPNRSDKAGRIKRSDGCLIDYTIVRLPDGQTMLTFLDVTRGAKYEQVLKERNEALVTADHLKDAFVQNVSYELRSPLTNIIGFADLLASDRFGPLNDQQRDYTDYIRSSSAALGILIDNILDLTHVDAGIAELDLEPLDISALIEKAKAGLIATLSGVDGAQPPNLVVKLPKKLPKFVADGGRIVQILYNLLSNAAKFSEPGAQISLSVEGRGDWIRFVIEDEGVGVPHEFRNDVFQRFEGKSIAGRQRGAGLGLTIVKAFVQLHGGTVLMENRAPQGTRVVVNLPAITKKIPVRSGGKNA